ncbi:MAG: hypothetical protein F4Y86_06560 [Gammaproteobacteria bacterium]|nr:hypothetical protein [Gammaproteobacteria bacterium]
MPDIIRDLDATMRAHIRTSVEVGTGTTEVRRATYALTALQELVRNAAMHRTYEGTNSPIHVSWFEDRVEIISPGGPYGDVSAANFGQPGIVSAHARPSRAYRAPYHHRLEAQPLHTPNGQRETSSIPPVGRMFVCRVDARAGHGPPSCLARASHEHPTLHATHPAPTEQRSACRTHDAGVRPSVGSRPLVRGTNVCVSGTTGVASCR